MIQRLAVWALVAALGLACVVRADSIPPPPVSRDQINAALGYPSTSAIPGTMYPSACPATVNSQTLTSTFCATATDSTSATRRTYAANALAPGKAFELVGGGRYTVPTGNTLTANIVIKVGAATVMGVDTPAAPVGTNQGIDFHAICTVQQNGTTMICSGMFTFVVAGTGLSASVPFSQTNTFDPTVADLVDVLGKWNGTVTTHSTVVEAARLTALN